MFLTIGIRRNTLLREIATYAPIGKEGLVTS